MRYGKQSTIKRFLSSPWAFAASLLLFVILAKATWNIHAKASLSAAKLAETRTEVAKLQDRHDELASKVASLSTDDGLENEIRTKYRAVKEGESVAVIVDESQNASIASASSSSSTENSEPQGWWSRFWSWFGI